MGSRNDNHPIYITLFKKDERNTSSNEHEMLEKIELQSQLRDSSK